MKASKCGHSLTQVNCQSCYDWLLARVKRLTEALEEARSLVGRPRLAAMIQDLVNQALEEEP